MCIPKAPKMPSAEEQAHQQLKIQRELQADADQEPAEMDAERKKAAVAQQRSRRGRRGRSSLITQRTGGLLGITEQSGLGSDFKTLSNQ